MVYTHRVGRPCLRLHLLHTLRALGAWDLKGPALSRAIEPLCSEHTLACELLRRLLLWAPPELIVTFTSTDFLDFFPVLCRAANRDKLAWLRLVQNSWATRGRFSHAYNSCLTCGCHSDRLVHLIVCRVFWRPVFAILGLSGRRSTLKDLILNPASPSLLGVAVRAHAALRGRPVSSASAWAEQVRAAAS